LTKVEDPHCAMSISRLNGAKRAAVHGDGGLLRG